MADHKTETSPPAAGVEIYSSPERRARLPIALEGWPFILAPALLAEVMALGGWIWPALVAFVLACYAAYFFRDPERVHDSGPGAPDRPVVCPADGKIIYIGPVEASPLYGRPAIKVSVFMNVFNVHVNRSPVVGLVEAIRYIPGAFVNASFDKASEKNERLLMGLRTDDGLNLEVVQIAGLIARRIVCWARTGDRLAAGDRFGLIRFGSRVDLYLPPQTVVTIRHGAKVKGGETILGSLS